MTGTRFTCASPRIPFTNQSCSQRLFREGGMNPLYAQPHFSKTRNPEQRGQETNNTETIVFMRKGKNKNMHVCFGYRKTELKGLRPVNIQVKPESTGGTRYLLNGFVPQCGRKTWLPFLDNLSPPWSNNPPENPELAKKPETTPRIPCHCHAEYER